jgi:glycosyltransferase involved in cell wall biosynthesis
LRVLIDTTVARRAPRSGPGVYVTRLSEALGARRDVEVVQAENPRMPAGPGGLQLMRDLAADTWWTHHELPRRAHQAQADLLHHPQPVRIQPEAGIPQVLTVHDLGVERRPGDFDRRFRAYARLTHPSAARAARMVIAVSQRTAVDVRELWGLPAERVVVAHHGPGQAFRPVRGTGRAAPAGPGAGAGAGGRRGRYFLYVGSEEPRKDLPTLLNAYSRYRLAAGERPAGLLLAGSALGVAAPGVWREPDPDPARLGELYAGALALAHPARYEGFGLTLLEAMSLRVPVVAARSPAVAEVTREAALLIEPGDPVGLGAALLRIATEPALRARLSARGRERATNFSWARSAQRHVEAYALALA